MYKRGNIVYADTYKYLQHKEGKYIALQGKGELDDFDEIDMELPIKVEVKGNLVTWNSGKLATIPKNLSYASVKKNIIYGRYSNDDQLAIMLNNTTEDYARMQEWRNFATEIARLVDEDGYIASTELEVAKNKKYAEIAMYDSSTNVNEFYLSGKGLWLDKATRVGLGLRFNAELKADKETTTLWQNGVPYTLPLTNAIAMLDAIELYASACYDKTQEHYRRVLEMSDVESVKSYDYTQGYPEKLNF